jgi:hypothetical protein
MIMGSWKAIDAAEFFRRSGAESNMTLDKTLDRTRHLIEELRRDLRRRAVPASTESLRESLGRLSTGVTQRIAVGFFDMRMFRIRQTDRKPDAFEDVGAPPVGVSKAGRLNEAGQSVLYLADSPDTGFAESRSGSGNFCLSEWRVNVPKLAMANGGLSPAMLAQNFPREIYEGDEPLPVPSAADELVLGLFREIYTIDVREEASLYRWSIACGLANGFSHICDRSESPSGITQWTGRYPLSAIVYPSVRKNHQSLNYALNDRGMSHVRLENVQWVHRTTEGHYHSLDFSNSWDDQNKIIWKNRPAQFVLQPGEAAKLTKVADEVWTYETADGQVPWFS